MKFRISFSNVYISALFSVLSIGHSAPGDLDTTFNGTGFVVTPISVADYVHDLALYADGRIVVGGFAYVGPTADYALIRYQANGALDTTFGGTGIVTFPVGTAEDYGRRTHVLPDGSVMLTGNSQGTGFNFRTSVALLTPSGSLDVSFGTSGIAIQTTPSDNRVWGSALTPENGVVCAGQSYLGTFSRLFVTTCSSSGIFGASWIYSLVYPSKLTDMKLQGDGKIVAVGSADNSGNHLLVLVRLNPDLTLDTTFNSGMPIMTLPGSLTSIEPFAVALQPDGKIVVGGRAHSGGTRDFTLLRYHGNGTLDTTFGTAGIVQTSLGSNSTLRNLAISRDGKIIAAGDYEPSTFEPVVVRYLANGTLDTSFGTAGIKALSFSSGSDLCYGCSLTADGEIVVAGGANDPALNFAAARLLGDGAVLTSSTGHAVPGVSPDCRFVSFASPLLIDFGMVAFQATIRGASSAANSALGSRRTGIWADDQALRRHMVAQIGTPAPGGGNYTTLGHPVMARVGSGLNRIVFSGVARGGTLTTPTATMWAGNVGIKSSFVRVAFRGQAAPGGGIFQSFPFYAITPSGRILMLARISGITGCTHGIYLDDGAGTFSLVIREGQAHPLTGKIIRRLQILTSPMAVGGQTRQFSQDSLIYTASFADNTSATFKIPAF